MNPEPCDLVMLVRLVMRDLVLSRLVMGPSTSRGTGGRASRRPRGTGRSRQSGTSSTDSESGTVREALAHYRLHVFETHKDYFTVVVGSLCPLPGCALGVEKKSTLHFHCSYCSFTATEILDLPLHMEKSHLAFYSEVSLVLRGDDVQRSKVYTCGECSRKIQGTVSIVHHLLTHEMDHEKTQNGSEATNNSCSRSNTTSPCNGISGHDKNVNGLNGDCCDSDVNGDSRSSSGFSKSFHNNATEVNNDSTANSDDEGEVVEINPLDLLTTVIDDDHKTVTTLDGSSMNVMLRLPAHTHFLAQEEDSGDTDIAYLDPDEEQPELDDITSPGESGLNDLTAELFLDKAGVYQCEKCGNAFKYQYLLNSHKRQAHQGSEVPFQCPACGAEYPSLYDLKRHLLTHTGVDLHRCQVCGQGFPEPTALKQHILTHSTGPEKAPRCESCGTEFPSKNELTRHIVKYQGTCNPNKTESVRCVTCNMELANLEALKEHRKTQHPSSEVSNGNIKKGFECDYCGKNFNCRSNLRDHLVVHTGEKPYPCDICGKSFSFIHNMKTHRLTHNEGRTELCPYCDKSYKSKISLYYHMKKGNCRGLSNTQVPEGYHRCTECLQVFANEERYRTHKEKNQCQTAHNCKNCGMKCSSPIKLQKHLAKGCNNQQPKPQPLPINNILREKRKKRNRAAVLRQREKAAEEINCERCNYSKDCCCTFSCPMCGKRVFSIKAYTLHTERTCPVVKQRRERIRAAIMEKKRKKDAENGELDPDIVENNSVTDGKDEMINSHLPNNNEAKLSLSSRNHLNSSKILKSEVNGENDGIALVSKQPKLGTLDRTVGDDDSNSGSLTDLSTFTSPNILPHVADSAD
ncbi:unnamed protein product, partial [Meganyctiphanes norvegica]